MFYELLAESRNFMIIPGDTINILFKQFYYSIFVL
jgi:hypothetical protein